MPRGSSTGLTSRNHTTAHIKKLLDSRNDREVLDGMRRVITVWKASYDRLVAIPDIALLP
jgi:hypothetical protein